MTNGWCDRYPNQGKQSGAFIAASFDGEPYILMNYQPDVLDHVFTLAHEAGHSMHSYYSAKHQPYQYYNYTIFVAEVASTFNEQLLSRHLMDKASERARAGLPDQPRDRRHPRHDHPPDDVRRVREDHARPGRSRRAADGREVQREYRKLLNDVFRPRLRDRRRAGAGVLPHPALLPRVLRLQVRHRPVGRDRAVASASSTAASRSSNDYLGFLKGGCSKYPLDLLRDAGVDMENPEPVDTALDHFERLVDELDELL